MACHGWLPILVYLASNVIGVPNPSPEGEEARKVLGSSVVTSVSVIMDHGNGTKTYVSDGTTQPLPKPQRLVGSPADLMEPDRYEFYTFDETGDLVKRLMTLEEIQSLIAAGGDSEGIVGGPSMPPYYDQNLKTNSEQEQTLQTMDTEQNSDMPGVYKVVQNVQNVLKSELAASQAKPLNQIPDLSMPDAASSWSILFPNVLDESLHADINHLSEVVPEADTNLKIPSPLKTTTSSYIPQRKPVTTTQSLKFADRQPTTESSLVIHYLPINAVPSKTHNKKPNKPHGGSSYDKYKPVKDSTTFKTTYPEATSIKPSGMVSTWSTLIAQPSSTTKENLEAIKLNPQLSDSFSSMLNQVTENPQTMIDDKYTKPSSTMPNKYGSTVKKNYTSIPLTTTMRVPNPVSTSSFDNKYANSTKQQLKNKKPIENLKLNVTKPVSTFVTTQYNRVPTATSKPFHGNNIQTAETKRPFPQDVTKQSGQTEYLSEFKNNGLQVQNLQQSSSLKTSPPFMTTPYNSNNVKIQASSQRPTTDSVLKENTEKLSVSGSTNYFTESSTKMYNPSQYVNNQPVMITRPASSSSIHPYTTVKPFTFFTTPDDTIFSEPFLSNASTQIYNPTLYINNQPILSTKPIQMVSPLRQSTTPMYHAVTETSQILSSQSYVSKPNPYLQTSYQTTPRTSQYSTNHVQFTTDHLRNSTPSSLNKFEPLKGTQNNFSDKSTQTNKLQGTSKNKTAASNAIKNVNKPVKVSSQPPVPLSTEKAFTTPSNKNQITYEKLDLVKNNDVPTSTKTESSIPKNKFTNTTNLQNKNKIQTNNDQNKSTTSGQFVSNKITAETKTNTPLPPKSNISRPNKPTNSVVKGNLKTNGTSEKYSNAPVPDNFRDNNSSMTRISQTTLPVSGTESSNLNKLGTTESNKDYSTTLSQSSTDIKTNSFGTTRPDGAHFSTTSKPQIQNEKLKENLTPIKFRNNTTNTMKNANTTNSKRPNSPIKIITPPRTPDNSTRKTTNKTTENIKSTSRAPLNSQNKGSLKISQSTSPKPLSSTHSINPSSQNYPLEKTNSEPIKSTVRTEKPSWSTISDADNKISTPSENTIYIRVNTTTPQSPSTERSSQSKITYTRYPESTSIKQTSMSSDYTNLDHIVHDGISAVTSMLQQNAPVTPTSEKNIQNSPVPTNLEKTQSSSVTPAFEKVAPENVTQKTKESVVSDSFSNLTTENIATDDQTETAEQTTTEMNYMEIKQNFATEANSKITFTSSQPINNNISTVPVMGETKHASTEAIQQLLNDLITVSSDSTSPTSIESASLVKEDSENANNTSSTLSSDDVSSISTEATKLTTTFEEDLGKQSITEQTTIQAEENLNVSSDIQTTTQPANDQDVEILQTLENNRPSEKVESTVEPATTTNTETYKESTTENFSEIKQNDEVGTTICPVDESPITTDSTLTTSDQTTVTSEQTTESEQSDGVSTTLAMLSELRTEAMDLAIETSPVISSTTETLVIPDTVAKDLNSTLATSTSTVQTTAPTLEEQISNKPPFSVEDSKLKNHDIKTTQETKPSENLKTANGGGVAVKPSNQQNQKPSTVELHPPPHEHMGLEASIAYLGDDIKRFADLCNELAFKMWTSLTGKGMISSRSLVLSPFAAISTLAMVFLGARGPTSGQMNDILKLDDMVSFNPHQVLQNVTDSVVHAKRNGIDTAAFVRELYSDKAKGKILDFYKERVQQYYDGHVEEIGFNIIGDVLRRRTNLLVKRQTMGKVPEYLRGSTLSLKPPLAAFTANIFQTECERASTEGRDGEMYFVVRPSTRQRRLVPVPAAVWRTGFTAGYEPGLDATAVSLNHGSDNTISSVYVLPGQQGQVAPGDGLARLEQRLIETSYRRGGWSRLLRSLLKRPGLELQLPRFSHRSVLNVTATLQRMGLKDVNTFSTCAEENIGARHHIETFPVSAQRVGRAETFPATPPDSSDILGSDTYGHLPLNLRPRQGRIPDAPRLRFDRPFLYLVRHNPTGMILYMGRFNPRLLA
ncbi:hypothetical protein M8J75_012717 [Diaphorina citri]|nr:hypothetical protein M8J75_012717 [Diaphorina citri]